jgi:hypothetical protein
MEEMANTCKTFGLKTGKVILHVWEDNINRGFKEAGKQIMNRIY